MLVLSSSSSSSSSSSVDQMDAGRRPLCPIHYTEKFEMVKIKIIFKNLLTQLYYGL